MLSLLSEYEGQVYLAMIQVFSSKDKNYLYNNKAVSHPGRRENLSLVVFSLPDS